MSYSLYRQDGDILYGVKDYIVDTEMDIYSLPTDLKKIKPGSQALVVATSEKYILNNQGVWVKVKNTTAPGTEGGESSDNAGELTIF